MRIAILSRNKGLHSIRRLMQEAKRAKIQCDIIDPLDCQLIVDGKESRILVGPKSIPEYDAIIPRIGASITGYGLAVVRQFETLGAYPINSSQAIAESRDKMRSLQVLTQAGLQVPPTVLTRTQRGLRRAVEAVRGLPIVLKVLEGTQGVGVMLVHTPISLSSVLDALHGLGQDVILQQYIAEGAGHDYRVFVIGGKVAAAMLRTAPEGDFRTNIHRGGSGQLVKKLPRAYAQAATRAARVLGLEIAGVDLMSSHHGPLILEVNSSPGFEGIEKATGINIAQMMIQHTVRATRRQNRNKNRKKRSSQ